MTQKKPAPPSGITGLLRSIAKRAVRHLPLVDEHDASRAAASLGLSAKRCGNCANFDPIGMQHVLHKNPAFAEASRYLSPSEMSAAERRALGADGWPATDRKLDARARWDQVGVCTFHNRGDFPGNTCEDWA